MQEDDIFGARNIFGVTLPSFAVMNFQDFCFQTLLQRQD